MNRYFAYCRKSTEDEDRQVLSIASQIEELKRCAARDHLKIVGFLQEARTAKMPGRPVFNDLLKRIRRGEADGILAWHPDRLARNALDGGHIIHLIDTGKLSDLRFPTYRFENTSQGKFTLGMMFVQSKYYVDSLSENIRRGTRAKRERGWLPNMAPIGYLNSGTPPGDKIIAPDPERFPLIKRLWELFLSGGYSVAQVLRIATTEMGLRTLKRRKSGGKPLVTSAIYKLFGNAFYAGYLVHKGEWLGARHEPMITLEQFERAQVLLGRKNRARPKRNEFPYTGLMRCGYCGYGVTAEAKMNRYGRAYVYYRCTYKNPTVVCNQGSVSQDELERQILAFLDSIYIDKETADELLSLISKETQREQQTGTSLRQSLTNALTAVGRELENLTRMRRRELITDDEFLLQRGELFQEQSKLAQGLERASTEKWIEPSKRLFLFANRAKFWLVHGSNAEKRLIVSTIGSNLLLHSKKLHIEAKRPFQTLSERPPSPDLSSIVNDVRTYFIENVGPEVPILPEPVVATQAA
jgi:site-specific DNA recombinase